MDDRKPPSGTRPYTFPAASWSVPKGGPNLDGTSRAAQLFPKLVDYEWDILFDVAGLRTPSGQSVIAGAAYNECFEFMRPAGILDLMGKPTELGLQLIQVKKRLTLFRFVWEPMREKSYYAVECARRAIAESSLFLFDKATKAGVIFW